MWDIGCMIWRIGDILDFDAQLDWIRDAGFEAVSFHASSGSPGKWRGVDPAETDRNDRRRLRERLSRFSMCEVHAPFSYELTPDRTSDAIEELRPVIEFSGDVGASILTIHGEPPVITPCSSEPWYEALDKLSKMSYHAGLVIGLEITRGFEWLKAPRRPNIGVTLDVGHVYLNEGEGHRPYETIGGLVRALSDAMVHIHIHDYDGTHDHIEIGTGCIDFDELLHSLVTVGYEGALCLELNPDRVSPEGIRRSASSLRKKFRTED